MKRDKLRIGVITAALAMMIAGGVLTWQQDARNGKADQAKQGETARAVTPARLTPTLPACAAS